MDEKLVKIEELTNDELVKKLYNKDIDEFN